MSPAEARRQQLVRQYQAREVAFYDAFFGEKPFHVEQGKWPGLDLFEDLAAKEAELLVELEKTQSVSTMSMLLSRFTAELERLLSAHAARQGTGAPDPRRLAAARRATVRKVVEVADRHVVDYRSEPVF